MLVSQCQAHINNLYRWLLLPVWKQKLDAFPIDHKKAVEEARRGRGGNEWRNQDKHYVGGYGSAEFL